MSIRKRKIRALLVGLMLVFIWGNSLLPGSASSQESECVRQLLAPLLAGIQRGLAALDIHVGQQFLVRKMAHFGEYAMLGFWMGLLLERESGGTRLLRAEGLCILAAGVDELLQCFAVNRGPGLRDVALDAVGAMTGVLLASAFLCFQRHRRKHKI